MTRLQAGAATDVGLVREVNEDRFLEAGTLFAVADGVGGHQAGEVAAQTAVETLEQAFTEPTTDALVGAVEEANRAVWRLAHENTDRRGMGTTLTAVALVEEDGEEHLAVVNVGDSRAYLLQQGELMQLTEDHSLVEEMVREGRLTPQEASVHPQRSVITRALGLDDEVEVDYWQVLPYAGDRLLLCSDGLTNELDDDRIASVLRQEDDPEEAARELVRQARERGGSDNITVVVVDVVDDGGRAEQASAALGASDTGRPTRITEPVPPPAVADDTRAMSRAPLATATAVRSAPPAAPARPQPEARPRRMTWRLVVFVFLLTVVLGTAAAAVGWYARGAYFVGLDRNQIAIFKGRPGGLLWFRPTLEERKPLTIDDVPASALPALRAGKEEPTKADADRYVNFLREQKAAQSAATTVTPLPPQTAPGPPPPTAP